MCEPSMVIRSSWSTSLPIEKENLDEIASGLGTVTLVPGLMEEDQVDASELDKGIVRQADRATGEKHGPLPPPTVSELPREARYSPPAGQGPVHIQFNGRDVDTNHPEAISGGLLAPKTHFFDITVSFVAPLQAVFWAHRGDA